MKAIIPPFEHEDYTDRYVLKPYEEKKVNGRCKVVLKKGSFELSALGQTQLELNCQNGYIFVRASILVIEAGPDGCEFSCEYVSPKMKKWPSPELHKKY